MTDRAERDELPREKAAWPRATSHKNVCSDRRVDVAKRMLVRPKKQRKKEEKD